MIRNDLYNEQRAFADLAVITSKDIKLIEFKTDIICSDHNKLSTINYDPVPIYRRYSGQHSLTGHLEFWTIDM